jgi:RNA polymerase sigma factor (sigma-70 family)
MGRLVAKHRRLLIAVCHRLLHDRETAEDVAQEASIQAFLNLDRLRQPERFGSWLVGIGLNISRQWIRDRRAPTVWSWESLLGGRAEEPADPAAPLDDRLELQELNDRVRRAVTELPDRQREAVLAYYLAGLTEREVAEFLGVRVGAVKGRLHRARGALRVKLSGVWEEGTMGAPPGEATIEMRVADVLHRPADGERLERFVVVLEEARGGRRLPIWIGPSEGRAIALLLEKTELPRPGAYHLAARAIEAVGGRLGEVRIVRLAEGTFYAEAAMEGPTGSAAIDARPSDCIALALITDAPIKVAERVLLAQEQERPRRFEEERKDYPDRAADIASTTISEWEASLRQLQQGC